MTLGERIQRQRLKKGWTQRELSRQARVDIGWINRLESGEKHNCSLDVAVRVAKVLGVSVDYLAGVYADEEALPAVVS